MARLRILVCLASAVWLSAGACRAGLPGKVVFAGQSALLQSGVQVNFQEAFATDNGFRIRLLVQNLAQAPLILDRDGFQLRLSDGRVLGRPAGVTTRHRPYQIAPGAGHEVLVDFRDTGNDMRLYSGASLIVGGISFTVDPQPRVVGEIPLAASTPR